MLKKFLCGMLVAGCAGALFADSEPIVWKFPAATAEWSKLHNATTEDMEDAVNLIPVKGDHGIINPKTDLDPKVYNCLRITYRAEDFKTPVTTGDMFFTTDKVKRFNHTHRFKLPSLIPDGKVRTLSMRLDSPQWNNAGKITALRLDITDQYPGDVHLLKIEILSRKTEIENAVWDFTAGKGSWDVPDGMVITEENGELKMDITRTDSHLFNYFDYFDASKYTKLQITYRATGYKRTTGGLFYLQSGDKNFHHTKFVRFPSLICDGKEHTLTVKVKMPANIAALRLDIVDQAPGTVWLKKIEFLP